MKWQCGDTCCVPGVGEKPQVLPDHGGVLARPMLQEGYRMVSSLHAEPSYSLGKTQCCIRPEGFCQFWCLCSANVVHNCVWWGHSTEGPLASRMENCASVLTTVILFWKLIADIPISLSKHNQALGWQEGVLLSQPHLLILQHTSFPPAHRKWAASGTALPENWLRKKKVIFSWINSPIWFSAQLHKCLCWPSWKVAVGVGVTSYKEETWNCVHHPKKWPCTCSITWWMW